MFYNWFMYINTKDYLALLSYNVILKTKYECNTSQ